MKKCTGIILALICIISLNACSNKSNSKQTDRIEVYDKNHNKILEIDNQEELDYFSSLLSNAARNIDNEKYPLVKLPEDAIISYKYKFISKSEDSKESEVEFYIYENYKYITLEGAPIISPLTWEISDDEYMKLKSPEN